MDPGAFLGLQVENHGANVGIIWYIAMHSTVKVKIFAGFLYFSIDFAI